MFQNLEMTKKEGFFQEKRNFRSKISWLWHHTEIGNTSLTERAISLTRTRLLPLMTEFLPFQRFF